MKISEMSRGSVQALMLAVNDIIEDKSTNTLAQTLDLIESQVDAIRVLEGLKEE